MKQLLLSLISILSFQFLNAQDTSYYNKNWKSCDKGEASYARVVKIGKDGYKAIDYYYPTWKIQMTGAYEDHELKIKTGDFVYFYPDGIIKIKAYYESDQLNDWYIECDSSGFPKDSMFFVRDKKEGLSKFYHKNKYLWYTENHRNGVLHDTTLTYYPDGKIKRIEVYDYNDLKLGKCFDKNGKKIPYTPLLQFPNLSGDNNDLYSWLDKNLIYPESMKNLNMEGRVVLTFVITENGELADLEVVESNENAFTVAALKTLKRMPKWNTFKLDNEYISFKFKLPIRFKLDQYPTQEVEYTYNNEPVFLSATVSPEFEGGEAKMLDFIKEKLDYPEYAIENRAEGTVLVSFIVTNEGKIVEIKVNKKIGYGIEEEAKRIVKSMPNWKPGTIDEKPVHVKHAIKIQFTIPN
jgi:TonB family protein